jgi:hypothetical protein
MKKLLGVLLIVIALTIAIVPHFTDCLSQGRALTLQNGSTVPMKCHWTGIAEIGAAVPLALAGLFTLFSRRKNGSAFVGLTGITGGVIAILFPTALIGVCANPDMMCNMVMKPTLIASGILAIAISAVILAQGLRSQPALTAGAAA